MVWIIKDYIKYIIVYIYNFFLFILRYVKLINMYEIVYCRKYKMFRYKIYFNDLWIILFNIINSKYISVFENLLSLI